MFADLCFQFTKTRNHLPPILDPLGSKATLHPQEMFFEKPEGVVCGGSCMEVAKRVQEALCRRRACEALLAYRYVAI